MHQFYDFPPSISLCFLGEYQALRCHTTPTQAVSSFFTPLFNYHPCLPSYPLLTMGSRSVLVISSIVPPPFCRPPYGNGWRTEASSPSTGRRRGRRKKLDGDTSLSLPPQSSHIQPPFPFSVLHLFLFSYPSAPPSSIPPSP
jgi:hypothetical protein